jgi:predicted CopG family antitoxin
MNRELTITLDEEVYEGLHQVAGPEGVSQFIEDLVRPHVLPPDLFEAYRLMAADEAREAEAHEWAEGTCGDVADEAR